MFFYRKAGKHGIRKAIVATAQRLLIIAFCVLRDGSQYRELGDDYFDRLHPERTRNRLVRRLQRLGLDVFLHPATPLTTPALPVKKRGRPCKCAQRAIPCKHITKKSEVFEGTENPEWENTGKTFWLQNVSGFCILRSWLKRQ